MILGAELRLLVICVVTSFIQQIMGVYLDFEGIALPHGNALNLYQVSLFFFPKNLKTYRVADKMATFDL